MLVNFEVNNWKQNANIPLYMRVCHIHRSMFLYAVVQLCISTLTHMCVHTHIIQLEKEF